MNADLFGKAALLLFDSDAFEFWPVASGALVVVLGGLGLAYFQRRWDAENREAQADTKREENERTALRTELAGLGLKLESEREERRSAISEESNIRREKDDALGRDISTIREKLAYYFGKKGSGPPEFGS